MKRKRHAKVQIIKILKEAESGLGTAEIVRKHGISVHTFYRWKSKFGGIDLSEDKLLRELEEEIRRLKRLVAELKKVVKAAAVTRRRWGCRLLTDPLRREGHRDNHKRIYRVYREEKLQVTTRRKRKAALWRGEGPQPLGHRKDRWSMDFMSDQLADGRGIRTLNVIDDHIRECLAVEVDTPVSVHRACRVLTRIVADRDHPKRILTDNGPEFAGKTLDRWAYEHCVELQSIQPCKRVQNAFIESFIGTMRTSASTSTGSSTSKTRRKLSKLVALITTPSGRTVPSEGCPGSLPSLRRLRSGGAATRQRAMLRLSSETFLNPPSNPTQRSPARLSRQVFKRLGVPHKTPQSTSKDDLCAAPRKNPAAFGLIFHCHTTFRIEKHK
jgi:putative transposase